MRISDGHADGLVAEKFLHGANVHPAITRRLANDEGGSHPARVALDPSAVPAAIQSIRRQVCEHFYLREMRDPDLTRRSKRRIFVLPHQVAKQLTGAPLQEIGREFGGRHHTMVLHSINKIEAMSRSDMVLDRTITFHL